MATVADYLGEDGIEELTGGIVEDTNEIETPGQAVDWIESQSPELATEAEETTTETQDTTAAISEVPQATDDHYFEQLDLLAKMAECERKRSEIFGELSVAKETVKYLNAQLKACQLDMQEIASDIRDLMSNTFIPERKQLTAEPVAKIEDDSPCQEQATADQDWGDGNWRTASTSDVLDGVKGLGKKKLESLCDIAPTIGDLEDLRGTSHGVFKNVLPHGFGDKVASEIEDRLIEFIAKRSTPPASEQVKQNATTEEIKTETPGQDDHETNVEMVKALIDRFRNDSEIEKWDARDCNFNDETVALQCSPEMERGFRDCNANFPIESFPVDWNDSQLSDWAYGYVCAEVMKLIADDGTTGRESPVIPIDDFSDL